MSSAVRQLHTLRAAGEYIDSTHYLCRCSRKEEFASSRPAVQTFCGIDDSVQDGPSTTGRAPAEASTPGAAWPPRTRVNLRRPGRTQIEARSSNSIHLMIQLCDFFRARVVVSKVRCRQASFSSQCVDLHFNQLKHFTFD